MMPSSAEGDVRDEGERLGKHSSKALSVKSTFFDYPADRNSNEQERFGSFRTSSRSSSRSSSSQDSCLSPGFDSCQDRHLGPLERMAVQTGKMTRLPRDASRPHRSRNTRSQRHSSRCGSAGSKSESSGSGRQRNSNESADFGGSVGTLRSKKGRRGEDPAWMAGSSLLGADNDLGARELPSLGTLMHLQSSNRCKPCVAFVKGDCKKGADCRNCHDKAHRLVSL